MQLSEEIGAAYLYLAVKVLIRPMALSYPALMFHDFSKTLFTVFLDVCPIFN